MKSVSLDLDTEDLAQHYERVSAERQYKAGQRLIEALNVREARPYLTSDAVLVFWLSTSRR